MQASGQALPKLKAVTLSLQELPRLEDLFASTFEVACRDGVPDDAGALKRLRVDLESILKEANKRQKLLAMELTKLYDIVEDPPEIEQTTDPVLLQAWRDKTTAEINEIEELERTQREEAAAAAQAAKAAAAARPSPAAVPRATPQSRAPAARALAARGRSMMCAPRPGLAPQIREKPNPFDARGRLESPSSKVPVGLVPAVTQSPARAGPGRLVFPSSGATACASTSMWAATDSKALLREWARAER